MSLDHPIPTVDLDLLFGEDDLSLNKFIETLSQACTHLGMFFIRSNRLTREDMDGVLALSKEFFALPPSSKECVSRQADDMARGYMSKCKESDSETDDAEETFDVYRPVTEIKGSESKTGILMGENRWPRQPHNFREAFEKTSHHLEELGHLLMSLLALALMDTYPSLNSSELSVLEENTENTFWNARIISRRLEPKEEPHGSHGDSHISFPNDGCLTFFLTGQNCGNIQFRTNGKWRPVELAADLLLVTLGDTMEIWTNGLWVPPEVSILPLKGEDSRLNYSFCFGPDLNSIITPIPGCLQHTNPRVYQSTSYGDRLCDRVVQEWALQGVLGNLGKEPTLPHSRRGTSLEGRPSDRGLGEQDRGRRPSV